MFQTGCKFAASVVLAAVLALPMSAGPLGAEDRGEGGTATRTPEEDLKVLLQQRAVLRARILQQVSSQFARGLEGLPKVLQAQKDALDAGLDAAETSADRVAVLRRGLKIAEETRNRAQQQARVGGLTVADLMRAEALVLDVKLKLLQEEEPAQSAADRRGSK
jgi:hypothetical protein